MESAANCSLVLRAGSLRLAVVYIRDFRRVAVYEPPPKFNWAQPSGRDPVEVGRRPCGNLCFHTCTGPVGEKTFRPSPSLAILLDLGRPDLDSRCFHTGDSGHLCDRDSAFDENGDGLLE